MPTAFTLEVHHRMKSGASLSFPVSVFEEALCMLPTAALGRGFSRGFGPRQWIVNAQPAEGDTRTDLVVIVDECFDHHATHAKPNDPNDPNDQTDVSDQTDLSTGVDSLTATALAAGIGCS